MSVRISVVSICYQNLAGLQRTLCSVERQTDVQVQQIVVDGASTDGTSQYLDQYSKLSDFTWISEEDTGIYDAMNKGLALCTGDLILILNSGDELRRSDSLSVIARDFEANSWAWAYGGIQFKDGKQRGVGVYTFSPFDARKFRLGLKWIPHATVAISSELADQLGSYRTDMGSGADQEYLLRAHKIIEPVVLPEILIDYETDGLSYQMKARERELAWHRMRGSSGNLIKKSVILDRFYAESLAFGRSLRRIIGVGVRRLL